MALPYMNRRALPLLPKTCSNLQSNAGARVHRDRKPSLLLLNSLKIGVIRSPALQIQHRCVAITVLRLRFLPLQRVKKLDKHRGVHMIRSHFHPPSVNMEIMLSKTQIPPIAFPRDPESPRRWTILLTESNTLHLHEPPHDTQENHSS